MWELEYDFGCKTVLELVGLFVWQKIKQQRQCKERVCFAGPACAATVVEWWRLWRSIVTAAGSVRGVQPHLSGASVLGLFMIIH